MTIAVLESMAEYERSRTSSDERTLRHSLERHAATNAAVQQALESAGHRVVHHRVQPDLLGALRASGCDLVFNTYFGPGCRQDQARVAALVELSGLKATGGDATCHCVGMSKPLTKQALRFHGLPTPGFVVCAPDHRDPAKQAHRAALPWPLIVKTSAEGEGIGIDDDSIVDDASALRQAVARVHNRYAQPAIVEEYVAGRELTVGVLDGDEPRVLPVLELLLGGRAVFSYDVKAGDLAEEVCPAPLEAPTRDALTDLAIRAGRAIGCRDYWRVDFRLDAEEKPHILEVNTLPGLMPDYSDLPTMIRASGLSYADGIRIIVQSASRRLGERDRA